LGAVVCAGPLGGPLGGVLGVDVGGPVEGCMWGWRYVPNFNPPYWTSIKIEQQRNQLVAGGKTRLLSVRSQRRSQNGVVTPPAQ
jgi:hypothetical protein